MRPAQLYMMDVVGGKTEYDVHRQIGINTNVVNATGAVDGRCPQAKPFGLLRCTGHLHTGMRSYAMLAVDETADEKCTESTV